MSKIEEGLNKQFGRLTVKEIIKEKGKNAKYRCVCECGNEIITWYNNLWIGKTLSCGCLNNEQRHKKGKPNHYKKHGMSGSRILNVRNDMIARCYDEKAISYYLYGGRGITVCDEWKDKETGSINFIKWAYDNGYDENAKYGECTLDRIDVNGNYEPNNCRWVSMKIQAMNKRPYKRHEFDKPNAMFNKELINLLNKSDSSIQTLRKRMKEKSLTYEEAFNLSKEEYKELPKTGCYKEIYLNDKTKIQERNKFIDYLSELQKNKLDSRE